MTIDLRQRADAAAHIAPSRSEAAEPTTAGLLYPTRAFLLRPATTDTEGDIVAAVAYARAQGWTPVSPASVDVSHNSSCPDGRRHREHPRACWYAAEVRALQRCDVVVLLPGWYSCPDARLLYYVALRANLRFAYVTAPKPTRPHRTTGHTAAEQGRRHNTGMPVTAARTGRRDR